MHAIKKSESDLMVLLKLLLSVEKITFHILSSPRAESARAFTGRRCPHSGKEEDFLTGQPDFLRKQL